VTRWSKLDFCGSLWVGKEDSPHNWAAMWRVVWVERPDFAFRGACSKLSHCILIQSIITTTAISHASLAISTDFDYYRCNLWPTTSMKYLYLSNPHETDFAGLPRRRRTPKLWHRGIRHPKTQSCRNLHRLCTPTAFYQPRKHQPNQLLDICAYCMGFRQATTKRNLCKIKGLSESKVDKIKEAVCKIFVSSHRIPSELIL